jgi:hypothetical protein
MRFAQIPPCFPARNQYVRVKAGRSGRNRNLARRRQAMTRDEFNRELRAHSASWQAVLIVYGLIVGTMALSAMAIL